MKPTDIRLVRLESRTEHFDYRTPIKFGGRVLNDVVLNQVLVRFIHPDGGDSDELTRAIVSRVQADGTCWLSGTTWKGQAAMRISISGWSTTDDDVDQSVAAIIKAKNESRPKS